MAMVSTMSTAGYGISQTEDKDTGNGFEFTRRKRWPSLLLQELVGSAIFCLKPVPGSPSGSGQGSSNNMGWKMVYASPAAGDMLSQKVSELEGRDFFDLVFAPDQAHLQNLFSALISPEASTLTRNSPSSTSSGSSPTPGLTPTGPGTGAGAGGSSSAKPTHATSHARSGSSKSQTAHVRMMADSPVVWELRVHSTGMENDSAVNPFSGPGSGSGSIAGAGVGAGAGRQVGQIGNGQQQPNFGYGGQGTMVPDGASGSGLASGSGMASGVGGNPSGPGGGGGGGGETGLKGKAIWVMGRRVADTSAEGEGNGQNLDAFLELKLENERLREELREVQADLDEEDMPISRPLDPTPAYNPSSPILGNTTPSSPSSSAESFEPKPKKRKEKDVDREKEKKPRPKKPSVSGPAGSNGASGAGSGGGGSGGGGGGGGGEGGMHVCVTCGRTDSPEWRKGPLGPKTLCNACGLRWAKRNSTAPTRKDRKIAEGKAA